MASKMIRMMVLASTCVVREGKRVYPEIGQTFDFTDGEIAAVTKAMPSALRKPVNESPVNETAQTAAVQQNAVEPTADSGKAPSPDTTDKPAKKAAKAAEGKSGDKPADPDDDI